MLVHLRLARLRRGIRGRSMTRWEFVFESVYVFCTLNECASPPKYYRFPLIIARGEAIAWKAIVTLIYSLPASSIGIGKSWVSGRRLGYRVQAYHSVRGQLRGRPRTGPLCIV